MSKERELIQQLKDSIAASDATREAAAQGAGAGVSNAVQAADTDAWDFSLVFDAMNSMGASMVSDPLFYIKAIGVLILTVVIILLAFELIAGG